MPASAQSVNDGQIILVTPEGDVLDYVPDAADVIVRTNKRGQRVLIDHYGNLVATEMRPSDLGGRRSPRDGLPGVEDYARAGGNNAEEDPGYFPRAPQPDSQESTGSLPTYPDNNEGYQDQPLPGDGIARDNTGDTDMASLDPNLPAVEQRQPDPVITLDGKKSQYEITALQVFLDRAGASPGVIDGKMGMNVSKAVAAYDRITGETLDPNNIEELMTRLGYTGGLPIMEYQITAADAAGPYVAAIPEDYAHKAALPGMNYTSVTEALAERFHMDEGYLKTLNPGVDFTIPGTIVKVVNPGQPKKAEVARIVADKFRKQVYAYDAADQLVAAYPASIGSSDTPSPSGLHTVERVALNPNYTYNPKINFQQGNNTKVLTIPPGPNGPVGTVWIALSKPTYGIHGTPDPSRIGRSQSHGCIRLTNWDATELAKMVKPGVTVEFID
ncbi:L,D-transpeptidase [Rhizobium sp. SG_E_25_P2]|uniref:L,D-transpeptidase n=1 Tax=Rhizobium sp. SG_E_25_P2 TaxID=2879942 RepID=UPI0024743650|nr:L,D-transpeptidase [Rhizobium sp. SG_E_25_P2]